MAAPGAAANEAIRVVLFGSTGMIGKGVLRECLEAPQIGQVLCVARKPTGAAMHAKQCELVHSDWTDFTAVADQLKAYDACFWCMGVSSSGMSEAEYTKVTYDYAVAAARAMVHPGMTFVLVTGEGSDSSEKGRVMWARVKGKTENAILGMPFRRVYVFRPGGIRPMHGIESKTTSYRVMYKCLAPILPVLKAIAPNSMTTTQDLGRAMLQCALAGSDIAVHHSKDMNALSRGFAASYLGGERV